MTDQETDLDWSGINQGVPSYGDEVDVAAIDTIIDDETPGDQLEPTVVAAGVDPWAPRAGERVAWDAD